MCLRSSRITKFTPRLDAANQAGNIAGEKWEQTNDKANEAAGVAGDKANQAKEGAGSVLQQVGDAVADT